LELEKQFFKIGIIFEKSNLQYSRGFEYCGFFLTLDIASLLLRPSKLTINPLKSH